MSSREEAAGLAKAAAPRLVGQMLGRVPPPAFLVTSAIFHYLGPSLAVLLFARVGASGVAWLRIATAAIVFAAWRRPCRLMHGLTARQRRVLFGLGAVLACMNTLFYLAIARLPLSTVGAIEFLGTIVLAAAGTRTQRNLAALILAVGGVAALTDIRLTQQPLGFAFAFGNCGLFVLYIILGHRIAITGPSGAPSDPQRQPMSGIDQLGAAMLVAAVAATPIGIAGAVPAFTHPLWLLWGAGVGVFSSVIPYVTDQLAMARLPRATFALMLALLPATATIVGLVVLAQVPTWQDLLGIGLVITAIAVHHDRPPSGRDRTSGLCPARALAGARDRWSARRGSRLGRPDAAQRLAGRSSPGQALTKGSPAVHEFSLQAARSAIAALFPCIKNDLVELARIPSISAPGFDPSQVRRSAEATAGLLQRSGLGEVRLLEIEGAHPAVYGHTRGPVGAPTVLLYAHHDIQPPGAAGLWASPPFEPTERDGRLYGRGTADDKAGIAAHAAALRAWQGKPPVGVTVFIEGEEESTAEHLDEFLSRYPGLLTADAVIAADCSNWRIGQPAMTTSLRGLAECVVEVRTLDHAVHSGNYGGAVPDALSALSRLLATLHDQAGTAAVAGLESGPCHGPDLTDAELRQYAGVRPGVQLTGQGPLTSRMWARPAVAVLGIDAPGVKDASRQLAASARAKISMRLAPGDDPAQAMCALTRHLHAHAPWGAEVIVTPGDQAAPTQIATIGPAYHAFRRACTAAWGTGVAEVGIGGSIPFVSALATALPQAAILLTGVQDPRSNVHASNESLHIGDFEKYCVAETLFLGYLGASG